MAVAVVSLEFYRQKACCQKLLPESLILANGVKIPPYNKIRVAETLDPLTKMPSLLFHKM